MSQYGGALGPLAIQGLGITIAALDDAPVEGTLPLDGEGNTAKRIYVFCTAACAIKPVELTGSLATIAAGLVVPAGGAVVLDCSGAKELATRGVTAAGDVYVVAVL